jgi:hypothetical protein
MDPKPKVLTDKAFHRDKLIPGVIAVFAGYAAEVLVKKVYALLIVRRRNRKS